GFQVRPSGFSSVACLAAHNAEFPGWTPGNVKLLLSPRQSRGISHFINPWDFILMIEGAIIFKPTMTRKLGSTGNARMSYPFTVEASPIGAGSISSSDQKKTRAGASEVWMPLWSSRASYLEITGLLREGSARLGAKIPQDGLDMARCIAKLGIDRGMTGFQRFLFLKRSGDNDLAVPLNRFDLVRNSAPHVDLINDLEHANFLDLLRSSLQDKDSPTTLKSVITQLANALFALTRPGAEHLAIQRVLISLGKLVQTLAVSRKGQHIIRLVPIISPAWIFAAYEDSAEFRIALALASLPHMTDHIAPVKWCHSSDSWEWQPESSLHAWGKGTLTLNLVRIAVRRIVTTNRQDHAGEPFTSLAALGARQSDIQAFLCEETDDEKVASLLQGLVWVKMPPGLPHFPPEPEVIADDNPTPPPICYRVMKPFFASMWLLHYLNRLPQDRGPLLPDEMPRLLIAGKVPEALATAWRRSRINGLGWPVGACPIGPKMNGPRLLAALTIPIQSADLAQLLPRVQDQERETA
uniref:type I-G CRISPR-associated protein Cas8g1/Csx17 n=1 Tax=uncultured Thiodictyon sp. TaxID=1846217 RepID=UPI0025F7F451